MFFGTHQNLKLYVIKSYDYIIEFFFIINKVYNIIHFKDNQIFF